MIFCFSAQTAGESAKLSEDIAITTAKVLKPEFVRLPAKQQLSYLSDLEIVVRKCAHFAEFALFGFNLACFLALWKGDKAKRTYISAWLIATLYAGTDELHQLFIIKRSARMFDICIDSLGALTGVFIACLVIWFAERYVSLRRSKQ